MSSMRGYLVFRGRLQALGAVLMFNASVAVALGGEVYTVRTNWVERWITNLIEVRMPTNRFADEYRTNWVTQVRTNLINRYTTNWITLTFTNVVRVDAVRTNVAQVSATNWQTVMVPRTNWVTQRVTNLVQVDAVRTNFAQVSATNWQTVLMLRTNWVTQRVTNISEIEVAASPSRPVESAGSKQAVMVEPAPPKPAPAQPDALVLEAARTARPASGQQLEVQLKVKWAADQPVPPRVQQWRIESEDGAILCFGQSQEFKRELPAGRYKVTAKVQRLPNGPLLGALGTLTVTPREAVLRQNTVASK